ncbi:saccharopine dehydrogenase NADP-binding domain-containing protein [Nocardia sp. XZ_19_385]|uniref:saccharopine dehydrogenase NADP-binding domain-containing protein n=1 Tax=Nocardia sp. XZ_19_385 TaxID=2769488 RepID=UPI00188DCAF1|nr:saccharopine dehydrogenase NADP-binding domain-containing protein [Nocardia sp. XZ_19_385]
MRVLVLGGYGAVGRHLVARLRADGDTVLVAGRDPERADLVLDLGEDELRSYRAALAEVDVVVNAAGSEDARLARLAGEVGAAFVDITANAEYVARLRDIEPSGPVIVDVGLAPGVTNLLAMAVHSEGSGPIDLAVLLGAGEEHGVAATAWTYGLLGRNFDAEDGSVRNFSRPTTFQLPGYGRRRRMYRADFSDQHTLTRELGIPVRTYFAVDSRVATAGLAALTWLPGAAKMPRGLHFPGTDQWLVLARPRSGPARWVRGRNQSWATALLAAAAVRRARDCAAGVRPLHQLMALSDLATEENFELGQV